MVLQDIRRRLTQRALQTRFTIGFRGSQLRRPYVQARDRHRWQRLLVAVVTCWLVVCLGGVMSHGMASAHDRELSRPTLTTTNPITDPIAATASPHAPTDEVLPHSPPRSQSDPPPTFEPSVDPTAASYTSELERSGRDALDRHHYHQAQRDFEAAIADYERTQRWAEAAGSAYMLSRTGVEMGDLSAATIALDQGLSPRC
jgi:hypothetical protein